MPTLNINETSLEYTEQGEGDAVLLVHGSASDYRTWINQQNEFAKHYRVINFSRRYHWPNEQISKDADYSMLEHVNDLQKFIRKLGAEPAHLVGHSYGAFLCLLLAIKHPELIRTLVLAEPPAITLFVSNMPKPLELLKVLVTRPRTAIAILKFGIMGMAPARAAAKQGDIKKAMRIFGRAILRPRYYDQLTERRLEQVEANSIKEELLGSGFVPLASGKIRNVQIPTLLVTGQFSHSLFHRLIDRLEELLPNCERKEIEGASHIMHEDNVMAYNHTVELFLKKHH